MSCIALIDPHRRLLTALTGGPRRVDDLDGRESLDELRRWGWVFGGEWIELTRAGTITSGPSSVGWSAGSLPMEWQGGDRRMGTPRLFDDNPPVVTSHQVTEMLGLPNVKLVQQMVREGRIPARRLPGTRKYRFIRERSSTG